MTSTPEPIEPGGLVPLPPPGHGKRDRGDVLVVGGAAKTPGAAALTGIAALRVGAGRLTLGVAASVAPSLAVALPEAGVLGLPEASGGSVAGRGAADALADELDVDCIVLGPGLDEPDETGELLARVIPAIPERTRVLLDAFALGALGNRPELAEPLRGRLILTPNAAEASRLLGAEVDDLADGLLRVADRYDAVVSGGGMVAEPGGRLRGVPAGGPGLGTSGSGDVLAGAIGGLIARGAETAEATCWATYLHARAGDRLAERIGPLGFLARELADELPLVLARSANA
ncbi:NAD(P)H-hydrate dehydratase [Amnibacterium sp. CER49]|uniref:NAD(P)H-hydrate dehydratase n=1 Tax=Amnibacterium sp. CER49 TaxID=3039161 RepID=UPI002447A93E|nr:NAD(P)H-hydrate dehydratase [Amnibacterium sp. CER49]MDH2445452.1 NAD(P)H-hydrate dehydratase [Amnibacterium sp. CER49]